MAGLLTRINTRWPIALLLAALLLVGFYPSALVNLIRLSIVAPPVTKVVQK